jgi:tetratricopeptide (TPR) repeat protein/transcriptional regulator with XRE-family HTH domain
MARSPTPSFAKVLLRLRKAAGLSQEELSRRAGLDSTYIGQLERGNRIPSRATGEHLATALGLTATDRDLLLGTLPPEPPAPPRSSLPDAPLLPLVGREAELTRLDRFLAGEGPPLLVLSGEPGIGKTRLLREAEARAAARDMPVLRGASHRRSGQEPYQPLLGALLGYLRQVSPERQRQDLRQSNWLVRMMPELAATAAVPMPLWILPAGYERQLMFAAARRFLANVAGTGQALLVLDDLQWAGRDALALLGAVLRPVPESGLRVVAAMRQTDLRQKHPLTTLLNELERERLAARWRLGTLSMDESAALLDHLLAQNAAEPEASPPDVAVRQRMLERADGVPFYLVSFAGAWRASGEEAAMPDSPLVDALGVPLSLAQSIRMRVLALPEDARPVLEAASIIGHVVPHAVLASVLEPAGLSLDTVLDHLEAASVAGLLVEEPPAAHAFAHDLIRKAVAEGLSEEQRQALNGRVARALHTVHAADPDVVAGQIALHYVLSDDPDQALPYLERAGDYARSCFASADAEAYYRAAVERADAAGHLALAARARGKLGATLFDAARFDAARETLERAVEASRALGDADGVLSATARIGQVYGATGAAATGIVRLRQVLDEVDASQPSAGLAALYATLANLHYIRDQYQEQWVAAERAAEVARAIDDRRTLAAAEKERGIALLNLGRVADARTVLVQAIALSEATGDLWTLCFTLRGLSVVYVARGELDQALHASNRAIECAQLLGAPTVLAMMFQRRSTVTYFTGTWAQARADAEHAATLLGQIEPNMARLYAFLILGRLSLSQGHVEVAREQLGEAIALAERSGNIYGLRAAHSALAELDLLEGRPDAARERLEPLLDRPGQQEGDVTALLFLLAWAYTDLGDEAQAEAILAQSEARSAPEGMRATLVDTQRVRALLAMRQRRWKAAAEALADSVGVAQTTEYPYAEARARYTTGLLRIETGEPEEARTELREALTILTRLGERLYAAHVERALAQLDAPSA